MRSILLIFFLCLGLPGTCLGLWYFPDEEGRIPLGLHHFSLPRHMEIAQEPHPSFAPYHPIPHAFQSPAHPCHFIHCPYNVEFWLWEERLSYPHSTHEEAQAPTPVLTFLGTPADWQYNPETKVGTISAVDITSDLNAYNFIYDPRALWRRNKFGSYQWVGAIVFGTQTPFSWKPLLMQTLNFTLPDFLSPPSTSTLSLSGRSPL